MGVLNVTPDSFSDGGLFLDRDKAIQRAAQMVSDGASIIDVGGESTRPGAAPVSPDEELSRVLPVIESLRRELDVAISVDTSTAAVIQAAAGVGLDLINDVRALQRPGTIAAAAAAGCHVCLMHMQGEPGTMQDDPRYEDVVGDIKAFFADRIRVCEAAGIDRDRLLLDPGFGFGKLPGHNLELLNRLDELSSFGLPLLMGLSRKSTIRRVSGNVLIGSVAGALIALQNGAQIVRVHDVAETAAAIRLYRATTEGNWRD